MPESTLSAFLRSLRRTGFSLGPSAAITLDWTALRRILFGLISISLHLTPITTDQLHYFLFGGRAD